MTREGAKSTLTIARICLYQLRFELLLFGGTGMSPNVECKRLVLSMKRNNVCWADFSGSKH